MRIGVHLGYWSAGPPPDALATVLAAERLGLASVWTAEAYGSDAISPLAWWGSRTERVRLGTAVAQMSARAPAATAMAALTLDHLSGGRFTLGLGVSGPQVVEGWYGADFAAPLARTRQYVDIVRQVLRREGPVTSPGGAYALPLPGGTGLARALRSTVHPLRSDLPVHLAAQGPRTVALAAEIADGWLPLFYAPSVDGWYRELLADDGVRERLVWEEVVRIDGMVKFMLEMFAVPYIPLESLSMQERVRTVERVLSLAGVERELDLPRASAAPARANGAPRAATNGHVSAG